MTGDDSSQPPLGVALNRLPSASTTSTWVVSPAVSAGPPPRNAQGRRLDVARPEVERGVRRVDQATPFSRVLAREQAIQRHVREERIAVPALAVGEGELGGLDQRVEVGRRVVAERAAGRSPRAGAAAAGTPAPASMARTCGCRGPCRTPRRSAPGASRTKPGPRAVIRPVLARPLSSMTGVVRANSTICSAIEPR